MRDKTAVRNRGEWRPAATSPVARVAVDVPLAHLDRPFDYAVPEHLDAAAGIGVRVRVRFAGRLVDGFVLERVAASEHAGRLAWLEKVVSPEQALPPEIAELCRAVADRYGGVLADVLRLALPPRHARVEAEATRAQGAATTAVGATPTAVDRPAALTQEAAPTAHGDAETAPSAVGGFVAGAVARSGAAEGGLVTGAVSAGVVSAGAVGGAVAQSGAEGGAGARRQRIDGPVTATPRPPSRAGSPAGAATRGGTRSCARWVRAAPHTPSGRPCPVRPGPSGWPTPHTPPPARGGARCSSCPTSATSISSTLPAPPASARRRSSC